MGSGASKASGSRENKSNAVQEIDPDDEDFSPPVALKRQKNQRLESANRLPKLPTGSDVKDVKRNIVGLDDSDDEDVKPLNRFEKIENAFFGRQAGKQSKDGKKKTLHDEDKLEYKLKRDIIDLEHTLSDIEIDNGRSSDRNIKGTLDSSLTRTGLSSDNGQFNHFNQTSGSRRLPPTAGRRRSSTFGSNGGGGAMNYRQYPPKQVSMTSKLKFSWQEENIPPEKDDEEEWTYKQVLRLIPIAVPYSKIMFI